MYPFIFNPILKTIIWGGKDICPFKSIQPTQEGVGESWELSHLEDNHSIVANGTMEGTSIDELISTYGAELLGNSVMQRFGSKFPLLIKFIDAKENLSIQVHPNDALAQKRHNSFGKTEMWYVINASPEAMLYMGFSQPITPETYMRHIENKTIMDTLQQYRVKEGDVFFLPAGQVHAIGGGCFIVEIQQTSNITYRIYDYDRQDTNGSRRELHTELAKDAIDYTVQSDYQTHYTPQENVPVPLAKCDYFTTNLLELSDNSTPLHIDLCERDSFIIYICMKGSATLQDDKGYELPLRQGQTVLIPANTKHVSILPKEGGATLLETFV